MSKQKAVKTVHIGDVKMDLSGMFLRFEWRYWEDGSICLHIAKWGTDDSGRKRPWWPLQYIQIPVDIVPKFSRALKIALEKFKNE